MLTEIFMLLVAFVILVLFVTLVSTLVITTPFGVSSSGGSSTTGVSPTPPSPPSVTGTSILWSENIRGFSNYETMPPCFQTDSYSKNIYAILARSHLIQRYYNMLDTISLLLCLEIAQKKECLAQNVRDRLTQLIGMGGNVDDESARTKASSFIQVNDTLISKLLVAAIYIIERQMLLVENDTSLTKTDKEQLKGYVYSFYASHISTIYKLCAA